MWDIAESSVVHVTIAVFSDDSVALEKDLQPGYDVPGPTESYTAVTDLETFQEIPVSNGIREAFKDLVQSRAMQLLVHGLEIERWVRGSNL